MKIFLVEWGVLEGKRPRHAGSNARLGPHGITVRVPIARITTEDGLTGFGVCRGSRENAATLIGQDVGTLSDANGIVASALAFEYPLWDLAGKRAGTPVYSLVAQHAGMPPPTEPLRVPCYDTSLYFDDLDISDDAEAAALIAAEAREGYEKGHRAFKIKVGRGARHLACDEGTRRDIAVIRSVRQAVGPEPPLMIDANNGYNLNLTKHVLSETADCGIYWMEEAFHEDPVLYRDLKEWLKTQGLPTLIADGEGQASPTLLDWAREGLVDVVQYDIFGHGFTPWLATARTLDTWGVRSAPHHYGGHLGNYYTGHLAPAIRHFTFVEWDEVATPGIRADGYTIDNGQVTIPNTPGFGLTLDEELFQVAVKAGGWTVTE